MIPAPPLYQPNQMAIVRTELHFNEGQIKNGLVKMNDEALEYFSRERFKEKFDNTYNLLIKFKLKELVSNLNEQVTYSSSPDNVLQNPNFKEIVKLGKEVIPYIIEEIRFKPSVLVWSLNLITGRRISENKVSIAEASRLWVKWGKQVKLTV